MASIEQGDYLQKEDNLENNTNVNQDEDDHDSSRVHFLHWNKALKFHNHIILRHEARIGALGARALRRKKNINYLISLKNMQIPLYQKWNKIQL